MIFSNKKYLIKEELNEKFKKVFNYLEENNLEDFNAGTYEIEGNEIFVNIVEYETKEIKERFWEGHRDYLDIHYIFSGREKINLAFEKELVFKGYKEEEDFKAYEGEHTLSIDLKKDDYLILYPEDIHMTCLKVKEKEIVKKAIFKVKI